MQVTTRVDVTWEVPDDAVDALDNAGVSSETEAVQFFNWWARIALEDHADSMRERDWESDVEMWLSEG